MMLKLKKPTDQFPQDGFPFTDPKTGFKVNGYEGTISMSAVKVAAHRRANPGIYPPSEPIWFDLASIGQEIMAQKHAVMPWLFQGFGDSPNPAPPQPVVMKATFTCVCGSMDFTPIYCQTCGGSKIKNWKCAQCGKEKGI